jgi:hypothetical protein
MKANRAEAGFDREHFRNTLSGLDAHNPDKAAEAAALFVREGWLKESDVEAVLRRAHAA